MKNVKIKTSFVSPYGPKLQIGLKNISRMFEEPCRDSSPLKVVGVIQVWAINQRIIMIFNQ